MDDFESVRTPAWRALSVGTIAGTLFLVSATALFAQEPCDCVASDYYASEPLPLASIVISCPDWPAATVASSSSRGQPVTTPVAQYRGELYLNTKSIPYADNAVSTFNALIKGTMQQCEKRIRVSDQALSGWNIVLLPDWYTPSVQTTGRGAVNPAPVRLKGNLLATLPGTVFIPLEETEAMQVQSFFRGGGLGLPPQVPGLGLAAYPNGFTVGAGPTYTPYTGSTRHAGASVLVPKNLTADIQKTLQGNGWGPVDAGLVQVEGKWYPAVLKRYGTPGRVYAYYGRFKDGEAAKHYGFTPSDQLYFSRRELVPLRTDRLLRKRSPLRIADLVA